ncbi:uncharacterized protein LOC102807938 [Saccoglossus kowalevskii]|uniref:Calcium-independent phospholipase A2-gamma-like n=1 Tax=Saccoglossus kowalevskii TaxID=10224 RepID=A0ABM0MHI1_SACKO|nr:PREDICTED: calcium-independent phospholipase A2-gamma-like [Saccoglossus kowalevskii]
MSAYTGILQGKLNPQTFNATKRIMKLPGRLPVHIKRKIQSQTSKQNGYRSYTMLSNSLKANTTYPQRALSVGKKFIQAGSGEWTVKISKLKVTAGQLVCALNQTNDDILKKIIETKQKLPSLPKLKLPSFPRFVLTQRVVNAQNKDVVTCDSKVVQLERKKITMDESFEREEHNLEKAVYDANKELVVYTANISQSPELVRERLGIMKNQRTESNEKKTSEGNNIDVYKKLATFAAHLPNINKLKEINIKKIVKNHVTKETESPVREEYDLETSILNTYLCSRMTTLPEETLQTLDAIQQSSSTQPESQQETVQALDPIQMSTTAHPEPQPVTKKESNKVMKLLSKAVPSSGKGKDKSENAAKSTKIMISQNSIDSKTKALVYSISNAQSEESKLKRVDEFCKHLCAYPEARHLANKMHVLSPLLRHLNSSENDDLQGAVRKALALVGYAEPVKGRGIRILSIDGGGTRGLIAIESLRELEKRCGKPIHEMFDFISCVSSGAVLACLVAFARVSLDDCENLFQTLTKEVFQRSAIVGTGNLVWSHSFYNTDAWIKILKAAHSRSEIALIDTAADPTSPKVRVLFIISVHTMLSDLMPTGTYFRFNPYLSEDIQLDEYRAEKIDLLQHDSKTYLKRNSNKLDAAVNRLTQTKNGYHEWSDWLKTKKHIYYK